MQLTETEFLEALPTKYHTNITQESIDSINEILNEPEMLQTFRDNFISYTSILQNGKYKILDYTNAIKYCSYKMAGLNNKDSYIKTFPDRYKQHKANGISEKTIDSYICAYNKNKLVTTILEQAYVPVWLINQDAVQKAINKLVTLVTTSQSEKIQMESSIGLLNHLKPPENKKVQLDIGVDGASETISEMREAMRELVNVQAQQLSNGNLNAKYVIESNIIEHKVDD